MDGKSSGLCRAEPFRRHLVWFLFCRMVVITLLLGGTILFQLRSPGLAPPPALPPLYLLVILSYIQAAFSAALLPRIKGTRLFTQAQVAWDLFFAFSLIYLTGGIDSPFAFLFILVILSASVFWSRKELLLVASASAILYGSLLDLQFYGYLPDIGQYTPQFIESRSVFYAVFVNVIAFFLTALLSGMLAERLRRSQQALFRREVDYAELESLNRAILASIGSGLLMINSQGRIRSFNRGAERITGYTLEDVYDWDIREIFPGFAVFDEEFHIVKRGEASFRGKDGTSKVFGYASSVVQGEVDAAPGLLVTFQDLTRLKEMEEELKRADRLAAVGQLAAGMAHEIRNPLASISGSVQLLMEGEHVSEQDRRLMRIVVKEAERLSGLLSDFLFYARPASPKCEVTDVSALLDELTDMAGADPRFAAVTIAREYGARVQMVLDRQQMLQALWNLAINGAEAMPEGGQLYLGIGPAAGTLFVEDSGEGVPESLRGKIFDPFFTTKERGTGLGLATVYAVVDAHGGKVEVSPGRDSGSRFVIHLPSVKSHA